jgi:hypothetical protein
MTRTLLIIAGAAFVLALATLSGAAAIGGRDLAAHGWSWTLHDVDGDTVRFERENGARQPDTTKTLAWTGGKSLVLDLPADVTYVQGDHAGVVITGPKDIVERVRLEGDRLSMTDGDNHERVTIGWHNDGLTGRTDSELLHIVVTAPSVTNFDLRGSQDLEIRNYDQDTLNIDVSGSGDVVANGRTRALTLDLSGSGEAELAAVATTDATVDLSGSGDARIAPTDKATLTIQGSGDIALTTRPRTINQDITGSGDIRQEDGSSQ